MVRIKLIDSQYNQPRDLQTSIAVKVAVALKAINPVVNAKNEISIRNLTPQEIAAIMQTTKSVVVIMNLKMFQCSNSPER